MIGAARADLDRLTPPPALSAVEQAVVILEVMARSCEGDAVFEAQENVRFTLVVVEPSMRPFWKRVLWCLTPLGRA